MNINPNLPQTPDHEFSASTASRLQSLSHGHYSIVSSTVHTYDLVLLQYGTNKQDVKIPTWFIDLVEKNPDIIKDIQQKYSHLLDKIERSQDKLDN